MGSIRARLTVTVVVITAALAAFALWGGLAVLDDDVRDDAVQRQLAEFTGLDAADLSEVAVTDVATSELFEDQIKALADELIDTESGFVDEFIVEDFLLSSVEPALVVDALVVAESVGVSDELYDSFADTSGNLSVLTFDGAVVSVSPDFEVVEVLAFEAVPEETIIVSQLDLLELQVVLFDQFESGEVFEAVDALEAEGVAVAADVDVLDDRDLVTAVVEIDGPDLGVLVDVTDELAAIDSLRAPLWTAAGLIVLLAGLSTWFLTGRALRPVGAITERVEEISGRNLHDRVPDPSTNDEIGVLAHTMNRMLGRLEDSDRRQRRFVSDASHELRTPVSVLRSEADAALRAPETTSIEGLASVVRGESDRLGGMIEDLLLLARSDEGGSSTTPGESHDVDLDDIVLAEAGRTRRVPIDRSGVSAARTSGRSEELGRAVAHLLDNAARHAAAQVAVATTTNGDDVVLTVDDDGAGVPEAERTRIFERFVRLDEARTRDHGGSGLGLAVVAEIVNAHGGVVEVGTSPLGGARFEVTLPAA